MPTNNTRARHTAYRLERGPSQMTAAEQAAAYAHYGTADLTPEQANSLARMLPYGVPVNDVQHMNAVSTDGEPLTLLGFSVAGVHLLIWAYGSSDSPQVALYTCPEDFAAAWDRAVAGCKRALAAAPGPIAESLAYRYGVARGLIDSRPPRCPLGAGAAHVPPA